MYLRVRGALVLLLSTILIFDFGTGSDIVLFFVFHFIPIN